MIFESIFVFDDFEEDGTAAYHECGSVLDLEATSSHTTYETRIDT